MRKRIGNLKPLPPGPRGLPILGNLLQLSDESWHIFKDWKDQYGDIVYLNLAGKDVIVINSLKTAFELFDQRSAIYSDRPNWVVACEMLTEGLFMSFAHYGTVWRKMRRAANESLHKGVVKDFYSIQTKETIILLKDLLKSPSDWESHLRRTVGSTVLSLTYDIPTLKSVEDSELMHVFDFTKDLVRAGYVDGKLVEFFPFLRHLPSWLIPWKRAAMEGAIRYSKLFGQLYGETKSRVLNGDTRPSFAASVLEKQIRLGLNDQEATWLVATVAAGSETMAGVLAWFMLAMVMEPDIQLKAQRELDDVVGRDRIPSFADFDHLPYIRAIVKESLRWCPVDPLGLQHRLIQDDIYRGYFIPKGTTCIANVWAMNRDPDTFGIDADKFNPERYLDANGKILSPPPFTRDESHVTFGFGRRICVGRHVANNSLFLAIASILWMFNITPPVNPDGSSITVTAETINQGLVVRPLPWMHTIRLRFPDAVVILEHLLDENVRF